MTGEKEETAEFEALGKLCAQAVTEGVVPGGVVLCSMGAKTRFYEAFGSRQLEPRVQANGTATVYDVASLTKAVVTSVLAMQAVGAGALALDEPVSARLPEFAGPGKTAVTLRHLLCHASGLPAHRPFYETIGPGSPVTSSPIAIAAAGEPLIGVPGAASVYSDLGFIVLGHLIEKVTGVSLDQQANRSVFTPLGLQQTTFVDLKTDARARLVARAQVAPTEMCPVRGRMIIGEVHDLNACAMGGIAGHAGLFSDAADLGKIAAALCAAWNGRENSIVARDVIREFWRPAGMPASTWRLGWDGPAEHNSQAGTLLSRGAVGHLGFTGCSIWIDPERPLWIVLLTNRVHPRVVDDPRFRVFRADVHDAAVRAMRQLDDSNAGST